MTPTLQIVIVLCVLLIAWAAFPNAAERATARNRRRIRRWKRDRLEYKPGDEIRHGRRRR